MELYNKIRHHIIDALNDFEIFNNVDLIIIARGGGSFEDLIPFNNEDLIRRIYGINIPIISAIQTRCIHVKTKPK